MECFREQSIHAAATESPAQKQPDRRTKKVKLTNMTRFSGLTALAFCLFFAGSAKADCSMTRKPRAIITAPDSTVGNGNSMQAHARGGNPDAAGSSAANSVVGLWMVNFVSEGQIVDQGFDSWSADGTEILNDDPPPSTGNVCLGTWIRTAPNSYLLKHPSWTFDDAGNVNGMAIIRETITVDPSGMTYKGTFTLDLVTLSGNPIQSFSGTISATRITVD
jgi:hypothetical protein